MREAFRMPDVKNKPLTEDSRKIKINETYDIRFWTLALNVSRAVLLEAVSEVGDSATAVREHLGRIQVGC
jgi:hypothetical protein